MARRNTTKVQAAQRATINKILSEERLVLTDDDLETFRKMLGRTPSKENIMNFLVEARRAGVDLPTEFAEIEGLGLPEGRMEKGTLSQFPERVDGKWKFVKPDTSVGMREAVSRATPSIAEKDLKNVNSVFSGLPVRTAVANSPVAPLRVTEEGARLIVELMKEEAANNTVNVSPTSGKMLDAAPTPLTIIDTLRKVPSFSSPVEGPLTKIKLLHTALLEMESKERALSAGFVRANPPVIAYRTYLEDSPSKILPRLPLQGQIQAAFKSGRMSPDEYFKFISELRMGLEKMFPDMLTGSQSIQDNARVLSHALHQSGFLIDSDPSLIQTKREYIRDRGVWNPTEDQLKPGSASSLTNTNLGADFKGSIHPNYPGEGLVFGQEKTLSDINNGGLSVPVGRDERTGKVVFEQSGVSPFKYELNEEKATKLNVDTNKIFKNANTVVSISVINDMVPLPPPPEKILPPSTEVIDKPEEKPKLPPRAEQREQTKEVIEQPEDNRKRRKTPRGAFSKRVLKTILPFGAGAALSAIPTEGDATPLGGRILEGMIGATRLADGTIQGEIARQKAARERRILEEAAKDDLIPEDSELRGRTMEEVKSRTSFMNQ
tara:strand:+ start:108 stop:1922 length:1815 start_codon:yes stop_codon:yes gene_type:complete